MYIPRASRIAKNVLLAENNGNHPRFLTLFARKRKILWFHCFKIACLMGILKKKRGFFCQKQRIFLFECLALLCSRSVANVDVYIVVIPDEWVMGVIFWLLIEMKYV